MIINNITSACENRYEELKDFKFICFNVKVKFFKIDFGRFVEHHTNYDDSDGMLLDFGEADLVSVPDESCPII